MSAALIMGSFWVVAASVVAFLPMRHQFIPGLTLLILAPVLIVWIGATHGWIWAALGVFTLGSLFRRPLWYLARKTLGRA